MAQLFSVDTGTVKSFKRVADYVSFGDWLKTKYNVGGTDYRMFSSLCAGQEAGKKGSEIVPLIKEEATKKLKAYYSDSLGAALSSRNNQVTFNGLIGAGGLDQVDGLQNYTKPQVTNMNSPKKTTVVANVCTWGEKIAKKYVDWAVAQEIAALQAPDAPASDGAVKQFGGVACAVYLDGDAVGEMKTAVRGNNGPNHAEMKWKDAHGQTLVGGLYDGARVDFHISEQPCSGHCAQELIVWWAANGGVAKHKNSYVYTYADTDGRAHVYALTKDAILRIGAWNP